MNSFLIEKVKNPKITDKNKMEILWKDDADLFPIMGKSKRFGEMIALEYINKIEPETEKQFFSETCLRRWCTYR